MITHTSTPSRLRILLVDDEPLVLDGLRRQFRQLRDRWEVSTAIGGELAIAELRRGAFDVVVSDMRMPGIDGIAVLAAAAEAQPGAVRFILSGYSEREDLLRSLGPAHRWLVKPCDLASLQLLVGRSLELRREISMPEVRQVMERVVPATSLPRAIRDLASDLSAAQPDAGRSLAAITQDPEIGPGMADLAGSLGLMPVGTDPAGGLLALPPGTVRAIALAWHLHRTCNLRNDTAIWRHGLLVSRLARRITAGLPGPEVEMATAAGLLHDCGRLVLTSLDDTHRIALALERRCSPNLEHAERSIFGCDHGLVGAAMLASWGLPDSVVEAVAWHHRPAPGRLDAAMAVHLADALSGAGEAACIDLGLLSVVGLHHRLQEWEAMAQQERQAIEQRHGTSS